MMLQGEGGPGPLVNVSLKERVRRISVISDMGFLPKSRLSFAASYLKRAVQRDKSVMNSNNRSSIRLNIDRIAARQHKDELKKFEKKLKIHVFERRMKLGARKGNSKNSKKHQKIVFLNFKKFYFLEF